MFNRKKKEEAARKRKRNITIGATIGVGLLGVGLIRRKQAPWKARVEAKISNAANSYSESLVPRPSVLRSHSLNSTKGLSREAKSKLVKIRQKYLLADYDTGLKGKKKSEFYKHQVNLRKGENKYFSRYTPTEL